MSCSLRRAVLRSRAGLLVGALGVGVGGGAVLRTRRRATERAVATERSGADL